MSPSTLWMVYPSVKSPRISPTGLFRTTAANILGQTPSGNTMLALTVIFASLVTQPAASSALLELQTGGGPAGPRFHVTLSPQGRLTVEKEAMPITENGLTRSVTTVDLSRPTVLRLQVLALEATDTSKGCNRAADGTNAVLVIAGSKGESRRKCEGAGKWPTGPATLRFIGELNRHVEPPFRVSERAAQRRDAADEAGASDGARS